MQVTLTALLFALTAGQPAEELFVAAPLTEPGAFTKGIEGPACGPDGHTYVVNFAHQGTIGRIALDGQGEIYVTLPDKSIGNGIRFDRDGHMFVADYTGHNILRVDRETREVSVFAHEDSMNQPNDLAITAEGTLYASDPNWAEGTGQIWRIDWEGGVTLAAGDLGTTNGIEISPDGKTLYVNESEQRRLLAFTIGESGELTDKRLIAEFPDYGLDGMRCDVDGNLYVTRHQKGTVIKLSPEGDRLKEIELPGPRPSNICFCGPDGRTAHVTEVWHRRLVQFRVDRPGLAWCRWNDCD